MTGYNEMSASNSDNNQCQRGGGSEDTATNNGGLEVWKGFHGLSRLHVFVYFLVASLFVNCTN